MVKFCPSCNNIFSHKIDEDTGKLIYVCLTCGQEEMILDHCIIINELNTHVPDFPLNVNMIHDYSLPRTKKILCPNEKCPYKENHDDNPELIISQYNPTVYKTAYMCTVCTTYWKN